MPCELLRSFRQLFKALRARPHILARGFIDGFSEFAGERRVNREVKRHDQWVQRNAEVKAIELNALQGSERLRRNLQGNVTHRYGLACKPAAHFQEFLREFLPLLRSGRGERTCGEAHFALAAGPNAAANRL